MKKAALINSHISGVIAEMGHTERLTIVDAGFPVGDQVKRIDLALKKDVPGFMETLEAVLTELQVEEVTIANETKEINPVFYEEMLSCLKKHNPKIHIREVIHENLKLEAAKSKAIVRTGEYTPFANVILKSGVVF
ncbi:D-ribose pyranase [Tindallia magadiensis]|uniref:D-ribose pyranase n=1 Tax=Tindallia magadiensis TaxID=69895 RepID=A0A1I3G5Y7_9FIRM|nr:D-ribose pyranase [Tindallia magadiensis]SFI18883.1 D-ribose pyranase [Tindallia magadiensis]